MSMAAFKWAKNEIIRRDGALTQCQALMLLMVADHYNEDWNRAWPSQEGLASAISGSVRSVVRSGASLRELRLLTMEEWFMNSGGRLNRRYLLPAYRPSVEPVSGDVIAIPQWSGEELDAGWKLIPKTNFAVFLPDLMRSS